MRNFVWNFAIFASFVVVFIFLETIAETFVGNYAACRKYNVVLDSGPLARAMKTQCHTQNRKYVTYRNAFRGGRSHGHRQHAYNLVKIGFLVFELCERTDRQTDKLILSTILHAPPGDDVIITDVSKVSRGKAMCPRQWQLDASIPCSHLANETGRQTSRLTDRQSNRSIALCSTVVYA